MKRTPLNRTTPLARGCHLRRTPMKRTRTKTTAARQAARNQPCLIRFPGCTGGGEDTVLCHYRLAGTSGVGLKPDDAQAAYGCAHCHAIADQRVPAPNGYTRNDVRLAFAEGVLRTQALIREQLEAA